MWQELFIFGVGTDENGANAEGIVNSNLLSSFPYLWNTLSRFIL